MWTAYLILTGLLLVLTLLPKIQHSHWIFRTPEFGKIQITFFTLFTMILGFLLPHSEYLWYCQGLLLLIFIHHSVILIKYTPLYPVKNIPGNFSLPESCILFPPMCTSLIQNTTVLSS